MIVGVLLAAGESTRCGDENELLASIDGEPIVHQNCGVYLPRVGVDYRRPLKSILDIGTGATWSYSGLACT